MERVKPSVATDLLCVVDDSEARADAVADKIAGTIRYIVEIRAFGRHRRDLSVVVEVHDDYCRLFSMWPGQEWFDTSGGGRVPLRGEPRATGACEIVVRWRSVRSGAARLAVYRFDERGRRL